MLLLVAVGVRADVYGYHGEGEEGGVDHPHGVLDVDGVVMLLVCQLQLQVEVCVWFAEYHFTFKL